MNLTPEQEALGRRNFLKVLAGTPAIAALGVAAAAKGPVPGGPVRVGFVGVGGQGRALLDSVQATHTDVRALCDINPSSLKRADAVLSDNKLPPARHYADWKEMLEKEDIEAVITAVPLWAHADVTVGCLEAGKHVLCEKMMAWDVAGCERMRETARRTGKVLEIGYQRNYNPIYQSAYEGIIRPGVLGDVYYARLAWHRNATWRRKAEPPSPDYDPSRWGYPTFDHLLNWRLYRKYSQGLMAELGSHQINVTNHFFGAEPNNILGVGGIYRFKDREVPDHVYTTFEYPGGRTATFTSIESNAFDDYYEMFMGTKGTLIIRRERDALLFEEGAPRGTGVEVASQGGAPTAQSSETVSGATADPLAPGGTARAPGSAASAPDTAPQPGATPPQRRIPTRRQIERFCAAIRVGTPLACGPDRALASARACIRANEVIDQAKARTT
jgi:predicted dehydrogenase